MLEFNRLWRFQNPQDDELHHGAIPIEAAEDFMQLIRAANTGVNRKGLFEHFARRFAGVAQQGYWSSTTPAFAEQDCMLYLTQAAERAPLFIESFYDAWVELQQNGQIRTPPVEDLVNRIFTERQIGYRLAPPNLEAVGAPPPLIEVNLPETTLSERAREVIGESLAHAAQHLERGEDRAAVMESLWLLDSVTTVFRGIPLPQGTVNGVYFNQIVEDLRRNRPLEGSFAQILRWMETMYGYLSAPGGGQIRHGMNLSDEIRLNRNDARLYCNLIRSYIEFLLAEHERLANG